MVNNTKSSSRFQQVFYNTGVGILIVDKNRTLIEVNPKFCETLGYTRDELIGKSAEIIHISNKTYKEFGERAFKQVSKSKDKNSDGEIIHKGISQRHFARSFTIADDVKIGEAQLKDGLLTISCEKIIPEHRKKKLINIK